MASEPSAAAWKRSGVIAAAALMQLAYDDLDAAAALPGPATG